jgi:glycosyltransferase involved in cell wall biosynthesis
LSLRVLHVAPGAPYGGAQRLVADLAVAQCAAGMTSAVVWLGESKLAQDTLAGRLESSVVEGSRLGRIGELKRAVRAFRPDIVHLHLPPPWMQFALPRRREFSLVVHLHTRPALLTHEGGLKFRLSAWLDRRLLARAGQIVAISDWIEAAWREAYPRDRLPLRVIYNGVPLPTPHGGFRNPPRGDGPFVLGMASRLAASKGVEEFLQLAARLHRQAPDIRFLVAGEGPMRETYEEQASRLGLSDVLAFEGFVSDMAAFWARLDLAAFTAPFEPFGLRLIEPLAHGVPVIAYRTGTGSDEVIERCRGITAEPYGNLGALAARAIELRDSPHERRQMAADGLDDVRTHFSAEVMTRQIASVYERVLASRTLQSAT